MTEVGSFVYFLMWLAQTTLEPSNYCFLLIKVH